MTDPTTDRAPPTVPASSDDLSEATATDAIGRGPAPSPCIGVCRIVESERRCAGCLRTLDEIASWGRLDDGARHDLLAVLAERRQRDAGGGIE